MDDLSIKSEDKKKYCNDCGIEIEINLNYCENCRDSIELKNFIEFLFEEQSKKSNGSEVKKIIRRL